MAKFTEVLSSRKFWVAIVTAVFDVIGWVQGTISADVAIGALIAIAGFWITAQARVDAAKITTGTTPPVV